MKVIIRMPDGDIIIHDQVPIGSYELHDGQVSLHCGNQFYVTHLSNVVLIIDEQEAMKLG